jgi:chromosomal replication initiation ATPase DnaA
MSPAEKIPFIINLVCNYFDLPKEYILNFKISKAKAAIPRRIIIYMVRNETKYSFEFIAEKVGCTQSSVQYAVNYINDNLKKDQLLALRYKTIIEQFNKQTQK